MSEGTHFTSEIRRRAVDAVLEGMTKTAVAGAYGVDRNTIARWVIKVQEHGDEALDRQAGSGRPRKLEDLSEEELLRIVLAGARSYDFETDLWTVGRLRRVITDEFHIRVSKNTIWRRLRDTGLTYQKPERQSYEIDEATRKKWLRYEVPPCGQEIPWNTVFPGRIEHFFNRVSWENMVAMWANASAPPAPSPHCCDGSSATTHVEEDTIID